jgi:hypothetical protein
MFRLPHRRPLAAALALLGALSTAPAFAGTPKVYPGSACQPIFESYEGSNATSRLTRFNGALRNVGTQTDGIDCPIVRDHFTATKGFTATVRVKNPFGRVNVAIQSRNEFGKFVDGAAGSITATELQELTLVVDQSVPEGTYTLGIVNLMADTLFPEISLDTLVPKIKGFACQKSSVLPIYRQFFH